jgi:hypothetical protein
MALFQVLIREHSSLFIANLFHRFIKFNDCHNDYEVFRNLLTLRLTSKFFYNFFNNKINEITKLFFCGYLNDPGCWNCWFPVIEGNCIHFEQLTEDYIQKKSYGNFKEFAIDYNWIALGGGPPTPVWYWNADNEALESIPKKIKK